MNLQKVNQPLNFNLHDLLLNIRVLYIEVVTQYFCPTMSLYVSLCTRPVTLRRIAHHFIHPLLYNSLFKGYSAQVLRGDTSTLRPKYLKDKLLYIAMNIHNCFFMGI